MHKIIRFLPKKKVLLKIRAERKATIKFIMKILHPSFLDFARLIVNTTGISVDKLYRVKEFLMASYWFDHVAIREDMSCQQQRKNNSLRNFSTEEELLLDFLSGLFVPIQQIMRETHKNVICSSYKGEKGWAISFRNIGRRSNSRVLDRNLRRSFVSGESGSLMNGRDYLLIWHTD